MRVVVGRIGRPHGVRGEVTIEVRTDEPDRRFADGATLDATPDPDVVGRAVRIERAWWHSGRLVLAFDGIDDRDAAESLRGLLLVVDRAPGERPEDPEEYYDSQLVGCEVALPAGDRIGTVREVVHLPAQDLLAVALDEGREVLVPFVAVFVPTVDVVGQRIVIDPPAGLLDADADAGPESASGSPADV